MTRLFELTDQWKELERLTESDELPPEWIADTLEGILGTFEEKAVAVAKIVLSLEADGRAITEAADAMDIRAVRVQKRADSLRAYLLFNLQTVDMKRIETPEIVLRRMTNPVAVQISDLESVPAKFYVQPEPPPPRLDKKALKVALQAGEAVSGAYLEAGERLSIDL